MLTQALDYTTENEEYIGWAAWATGPFWGTAAPCCCDGTKLGSLEPSSAAGVWRGGAGLYNTVWEKTIEPLLPTTLQRTGLSSVDRPVTRRAR